ncbi:sensor domain-containing protein [Streptosporangium sp. NPDC000396]|uniref:sensor histidine kinase n=1 Tax=Streptosporangium sp. NPDC000396 TaxID=3366185 RepID=UPI003692A9FF
MSWATDRESSPRPGLIGWLGSALGDLAGWRAVAYRLAKLPAALLASGTAAGLWGSGLILLSCPIWWRAPAAAHLPVETWPRALLASAAGTALLLLAPWAVRAALVPDRLLVRALLGPARAAARIHELEVTRAQAVDDSAAALRRIERDLHDGTQARLVALAMSLSMVKEELAEAGRDDRLDRTRGLVDLAHRNAKKALTELRDLVRGIHPAVLDKGLETALATLAAGSALPVDLHVDLPRRPSAAVETIAYFCTAELLTNAARHSGARQAVIELRTRNGLLRLHVRDDGSGGAAMGRGTGLRGLADRVRVVDGTMEISSPPGGPTVVTVELPLPTWTGATCAS